MLGKKLLHGTSDSTKHHDACALPATVQQAPGPDRERAMLQQTSKAMSKSQSASSKREAEKRTRDASLSGQ